MAFLACGGNGWKADERRTGLKWFEDVLGCSWRKTKTQKAVLGLFSGHFGRKPAGKKSRKKAFLVFLATFFQNQATHN